MRDLVRCKFAHLHLHFPSFPSLSNPNKSTKGEKNKVERIGSIPSSAAMVWCPFSVLFSCELFFRTIQPLSIVCNSVNSWETKKTRHASIVSVYPPESAKMIPLTPCFVAFVREKQSSVYREDTETTLVGKQSEPMDDQREKQNASPFGLDRFLRLPKIVPLKVQTRTEMQATSDQKHLTDVASENSIYGSILFHFFFCSHKHHWTSASLCRQDAVSQEIFFRAKLCNSRL